MEGTPRTCSNCGHRCHCYQPDCDECVNDVCTQCECQNPGTKTTQDIPDTFLKRN